MTGFGTQPLFFFAVYVDELLKDLRRLKVGCIIGGKFLGAMAYADDFILIAPCRSAMAQMLIVCEMNFNR